ncbi:hypothetical protein ACM39_13585 [Chryseobacterium sp. FH2]|uniref:GLPGLI family protein n=1 Tax=Chryseobacterium sp. FH2 TaxID=1674291 RepID=UPI00065AA341|nr:GLPGLI family protein [Chryseobacterium sp. FH2]KMQ67464.1 hypothetical protein ACM39_13585 [Chryseobacterium sp. FH2]
MYYYKKLFQLFLLFFATLFYSQSDKKDSLHGDFTYLLKAKLNTQTPDYKHEEFFTLQVGNMRAFFASTQSLKRDSVLKNSTKTITEGNTTILSLKGVSVPKTNFPYTIIQSNENIQYFRLVGMSLLTYKEPTISNWKLINESKVINTISCKKAELNYKGRNWIAWYSTEIPFPYGPYKFSGLPGLIIKITDDKGDYEFELVKSVPNDRLRGKVVSLYESRYTNAAETTQPKFEQALKDANDNAIGMLASYGTTIIEGKEMIQQKIKERQLNKKYENPIELSN